MDDPIPLRLLALLLLLLPLHHLHLHHKNRRQPDQRPAAGLKYAHCEKLYAQFH